jgi:hypothetical protein
VRASKELDDRMDTSVGPFRVEVLEGLKRVRFILEPTGHGVVCDLQWRGAIPAFLEPRQYIRKYGRVLFDTMRFAQTGFWSGTLEVGGEHFDITPDRWWGTRDRSWGVRPVGEKEPSGIRAAEGQMGGMWNYSPMQFADFSILYILNEADTGERPTEEAVRIWADPSQEPEWLGRPEFDHTLLPGTRMVSSSVLSFPQAPSGAFDVKVSPLTHVYITVGTGYGMEDDWGHGMYQGPLVVQGLERDMHELDEWAWYGVVDHVARFDTDDAVGYGLHEHGFFGPFRKYGLQRADDGA